MENHPVNHVLDITMQKLREMVDVNTVIGTPVTTPDGVTVIPVSKVSIGFASGGTDFAPKSLPSSKENCFGGGTGAGVSIIPVSFLIIRGENVRVIPVEPVSGGPVETVIDLMPEIVDKVTAIVDKSKGQKADGAKE